MKLKTEQRSESKWEKVENRRSEQDTNCQKAPDKVSTLGTVSKTETETGKISSN
jgi:hypothetical protein